MTEEWIIKELGGIKDDFDSVMKNPVDKILIEYRNAVKFLIRDQKAETEYLINKEAELKDLLDLGIYKDSRIAQKYAAVLDIYKRLFLIFTKYTEVADESIKNVKKVVREQYLTKKEFERDLKNKVKYYKGISKGSAKKEIEEFDEFIEKEKKKPNPWKWKGKRKPNPWLEHLDKVRKENPSMPPPEAATLAKETYKKND